MIKALIDTNVVIDIIITRNTKDYHKIGNIQILSPADFIKQLK
jgi:predicted nucleic acid-binding protein